MSLANAAALFSLHVAQTAATEGFDARFRHNLFSPLMDYSHAVGAGILRYSGSLNKLCSSLKFDASSSCCVARPRLQEVHSHPPGGLGVPAYRDSEWPLTLWAEAYVGAQVSRNPWTVVYDPSIAP